MNGFEPKLVLKRGLIDVDYMKCPSRLMEDDRRDVSRMVESMHMPREVMEARLQDVDFDDTADDSRIAVIEAAKDFLNDF